MLLCNALLLEQKPRTLGITKFPKRHYDYPLNQKNGMRRASEIAMYIKVQIYILITHFLISNIITIFLFSSFTLRAFQKSPECVFRFIKQYKSHFFYSLGCKLSYREEILKKV